MKDKEIVELLDKMAFSGVPLTDEEKEELHGAVMDKFKSGRLRRFIELNYVLLVIGLLLAGSFGAAMVTGYDSNEVLFYVTCMANLVLCSVTVAKSLKRAEIWIRQDRRKKNG